MTLVVSRSYLVYRNLDTASRKGRLTAGLTRILTDFLDADYAGYAVFLPLITQIPRI